MQIVGLSIYTASKFVAIFSKLSEFVKTRLLVDVLCLSRVPEDTFISSCIVLIQIS